MSKVLMCRTPETLEWVTREDPSPAEGQVSLRSVFSAAKHGTDLAFYKGSAFERGTFDPELELFNKEQQDFFAMGIGNMVVGEITQVGPGVSDLAAGDRAAASAPFADVHLLSAQACRKVPAGVPVESAVCLDPAVCALGAVRDGSVRVGDRVAVFGMGAIGLCTIQVARFAGAASVIAVDPLSHRRDAASTLGADIVLDPLSSDAGLEIKKATANRGADVIIDFSGSMNALQDALRGIAFGGCVVAGSFPKPYPAGLDFGAEAHLNVPNLVFSRSFSDPNRDHPRWDYARICDTAWQLIVDGVIDGRPIVVPVVPFEDALEEYERVIPDAAAGIKLGVRH